MAGEGAGGASGGGGPSQGPALAIAIIGAVSAAAGAYYSAVAQRYAADSQALDLDYQASLSALNASLAGNAAQETIAAGQAEGGRLGLQYRQLLGEHLAETGARGVEAGVGSAAEARASILLAKESDRINLNMNTVRATNALRLQQVNLQNESLLFRTRAEAVRRMAGKINPILAGHIAAGNSFFGSSYAAGLGTSGAGSGGGAPSSSYSAKSSGTGQY